MNSRERVRAALKREKTDRIPVFMWFHPETVARLARLLEIPAGRVADAMGNDIRQAWVNNNHAMEGVVHAHDGEGHTDLWGIEWVKQGPYNQIARFPLADATPAEVRDYRFPEAHMETLLQPMAEAAAAAGDHFLGCDVSPCVFEMYWRLRGLERTLEEMASEPDLTATMFRRCADFALRLSEQACARFPLDWLWTGDDVASQQALLMSPRAWRALVKPELARLFAVGRARSLPVAYHCCGALRPIIGDLVEIGLDVLNPIQCNCPGMEPAALKREFGASLTFMGGVDTQYLLPCGTAEEVYRETARLIEVMTADGGGYILAASHTVPPETPDANLFAMYAAAGMSREEIYDRAAAIRRECRELPETPEMRRRPS